MAILCGATLFQEFSSEIFGGGEWRQGTDQPEVQDFDLAFGCDLHVGRLQVPMDDPCAMSSGQSVGDLDGILQSQREPHPFAWNQIIQGLSGDV
jgi:hypothetical protein